LEDVVQLKELKALADNIEKRLKKLQKTEEPKEKQPIWDGVVNDTLSLADALEKAVELMPDTGYERLAFKQAVEKAKKEAALETAAEESILLNPELLKDLRRRLLED
jgi:sugar-specific transcriptional regulator TrmB